ncbi:MAG: signal peptidase I [Deltaproteobacteria bacterium]|nr:signal peptidase I [Deltaproteobacteria bacterium]
MKRKNKQPEQKQTRSAGSRIIKSTFSRENIEAIVIAVVLALFIRAFIVQAFKIPSGSMEPTLLIGDHILVNKFIFGIKIPFIDKKALRFTSPERGDVVVFIYPGDPSKDYIKRVVGIAGDTIKIRNKRVYINDKPASDEHAFFSDTKSHEQWRVAPHRDNYGPITVPKDSLFVMGDNRDKSYDSRFWGFVNVNKVKGQAFLIYWSWEKPFRNFRWRRLAQVIH